MKVTVLNTKLKERERGFLHMLIKIERHTESKGLLHAWQ